MNDTIYVLILVGLGVVLAFFTARAANNRESTKNPIANVFNFLASGLIAMVAPTVLCNIFFIHPNFLGRVELAGLNLTVLVHVLLIAFSMLGVAVLLLIPYAFFEKSNIDAAAQREDQGWTREDAESSGL